MFITVSDFKNLHETIAKEARMGEKIISALEKDLAKAFAGVLALKRESQYKLQVTYYGFQLVFYIEIDANYTNVQSFIRVCLLSNETPPKEVPTDLVWTFDSQENIRSNDPQLVDRPLSINDFAPIFIGNVLAACFTGNKTAILRP